MITFGKTTTLLLSLAFLQHCCCCLALHLNTNQNQRQPQKAASLNDQIKQWTTTTALGISLAVGSMGIGGGGVVVEPANAAVTSVTTERTTIELNVETDYLVRVLNYFDGDMKRTLGAVVRSPYSSVSIDPPNQDARDALLRSLYSYEQPDEYQTQASWLKIQPTKNIISKILDAEYKVGPVTFNNLQVALVLAIASYPFAFGYYKYEAQKEEEAAAAKRAAMAAKREKAAAAAAAKKKKENSVKGGESTNNKTNIVQDYGEEG